MRFQHFKKFCKTALEQFTIFRAAQPARNRPYWNDTFARYAVETPVESVIIAPTNVVSHRAAECAVPIAESSHSIGVENFPREREVKAGWEVGRYNPREVSKNFRGSSRLNPYSATCPVEFIIVLVEMNESIHEKVFVSALHLPIVNCPCFGVRDECLRNLFRGRRAKRVARIFVSLVNWPRSLNFYVPSLADREVGKSKVSYELYRILFDAIIEPLDLKNRNGDFWPSIKRNSVALWTERKKSQLPCKSTFGINRLSTVWKNFKTNIIAELVPNRSDLCHQMMNLIESDENISPAHKANHLPESQLSKSLKFVEV